MTFGLARYAYTSALAIAVISGGTLAAISSADAGPRGRKLIPLIGAGIVAAGIASAIARDKQREREQEYRRSRRRSNGGLSRDQLATAQEALASLGLYKSTIDGLNGPGTRSAVRQFQKDNGYKVTGYLTRQQYQSLVSIGQSNQGGPAVGQGPEQQGPDQQPTQQGSAPEPNQYGEQYQPGQNKPSATAQDGNTPPPSNDQTASGVPLPRLVPPPASSNNSNAPADGPAAPSSSFANADKQGQLPQLSAPE